VATPADARERVLAARAELGDQLQVLDASARSAADIPAKIKRSPAKAAAVVGGVGFLALKGPQRLFGLGKRAIRGKDAALPDSMLPDEIEKTLRKMGKDGDKVRGTLERDVADYAQKAQKERHNRRNLLLFAVVQPLAIRGAKAAADFLFAPDPRSFQERLDAMRGQLDRGRAGVLGAPETDAPPDDLPPTAAGTIADPDGPAR
jgi:hypothetical protein